MSADDHERARHLAPDARRQADRPIAFRREVALQTDDVRIECATEREPLLLAVDTHIDDPALVAIPLQARRDADRAKGLDKRQHLQTENAADGRLEERNLHF